LAILASTIWLLFVQAYRPWQFYGKPSSLLERVGFFFWRVGFNIERSKPLAVTVGLISITLLIYMSGWVVRSFKGFNAVTSLDSPSVVAEAEGRRWHTDAVKLVLRKIGLALGSVALATTLVSALILIAIWVQQKTVEPKKIVESPAKTEQQPQDFFGFSTTPRAAQPQQPKGDLIDQLLSDQPAQPESAQPKGDIFDQLLPDEMQKQARKATRSPNAPITVRPEDVTASPTSPAPSPNTDLGALARNYGAIASLDTGTWIHRPSDTNGHCVLKIQNGTGLDSAVKLVTLMPPRKTLWIVYIRAHDEATVRAINPGGYLLRFALGQDWESRTRRFLRDVTFYQAGKQLDFTETDREYSELSVTLHELVTGNVPRKEITEAVFDEGGW